MKDKILELYQKAITLHQQGEITEAKKIYEKILHEMPMHAPSLHALGVISAQTGNFERAMQWLEQALFYEPQSEKIHAAFAMCHQALKHYDKAKKHYEIALQAEDVPAEIHNNFASLLMQYQEQEDELEKALKHLVKAVHLQPDYIEAHFNLGILFLRQNKLIESARQFRNVVKLDPEAIKAHYQLGCIYLQLEKLTRSEMHFKKVLEANMNLSIVYNNLGVMAIKKKKDQIAIDYFTQALIHDEKNLEARSNMATLFLANQRFENAIRHYEEYLKLSPSDLSIIFDYGVALLSNGQYEEALRCFFQVLESEPSHDNAHRNIGLCYQNLNNIPQALKHYHQVLQRQPHNKILIYLIAALSGKGEIPPEAPPNYIAQLFDEYAMRFERHLEFLEYQAPYLLAKLVKQYSQPKESLKSPSLEVLDLGCGTGLVGKELYSYAKHLTGIDLSQKMIGEARKKGIYHSLYPLSIADYFNQFQRRFDVIVAADVFCYLGDLETTFTQCAAALYTQGIFLFTVEKLTKGTYGLQKNGTLCS